MRIEVVEWDEGNDWKPAAHGVEIEEVEDVLFGGPYVRRSRSGRFLTYGVGGAGRYILVVFIQKPEGVARPVTARVMDSDERRLYLRDRR